MTTAFDDNDDDMLERLGEETRLAEASRGVANVNSFFDEDDAPPTPLPRAAIPRQAPQMQMPQMRQAEPFDYGEPDTAPAKRGPGRPPKNRSLDAFPSAVAAQLDERQFNQEDDMTKRGRQKNAMKGQGPLSGSAREVPIDKIQEAIDQGLHELGVAVKLFQRNARGNIAYIDTPTFSLDGLMSIEEYLKNKYGGGRYRVEPRELGGTKRADPIPFFEIEIGGKTFINADGSLGSNGSNGFPPGMQMPGMPGMMPPGLSIDPSRMPPFVRGMNPEQQVAYFQQNPQMGAYTQPVMSMTPDALAVGELDKAQKAIERMERMREVERKTSETKLAEVLKRLDEQKAELADQRAKENDRARQMEMAQLRDDMRRRDEQFKELLSNERNKKPAFDLTGFAAIVGAIAPVVTALIVSNKDQASKSLEVQAQGINNLMQATLSKADTKPMMDFAMKMIPLATPLIAEYMKAKSPGAQADLVATMAENQLTSIGMMAKLVSDMMPESENAPPWLEMVQRVMGGLVGQAEAMMNSNKASVGIKPPASYQPPMQRLTPAQQAVGVNSAPQSQPQAQTIPAGAGAQIAQMMAASPQVPDDLKTKEWLFLVERLHDKAPVEEVAKLFATHVRNLDEHLPAVMAGFWDAGGAPAVMTRLFSNLPIWQWDQAYVQAFIDKAMDELTAEDEPRPFVTPPPTSAVDFFSTAG